MSSFITLLFSIFLSFSVFSQEETILISCGDHSFEFEKGHYVVLRSGDALFARYKTSSDQDYITTDDVVLDSYEGELLDELRNSGELESICDYSQIDCTRLNRVQFYGINEDIGGDFEIEIWSMDLPDAMVSIAKPSHSNPFFCTSRFQ